MKKILTAVLLTVMLVGTVTLLNGCGSDSEFVGEWEMTSISYLGTEVSAEEAGQELTLDIKGNGKITGGSKASDGDSQWGKSKWTEKDGKITIIDDTDETFEMTGEIKDGNLVLDVQGVDMTFKRK